VRYDVLFYWDQLKGRDLTRTAVVVADVLRATTVMAHALQAGADKILPQASDEEARRVCESLKSQGQPVMLCGEKDGIKRPGYDLGNSPAEFKPETVKGKTLVHLTTNGTRALKASECAPWVYTASFSNLSILADRLTSFNDEIDTILGVVSGREGEYCIEDTVCLGGVFTYLLGPPGGDMNITDAGRTAIDLFQLYRGHLITMLRQSFHGRYLESIGLGDDLPLCVEIDTVNIVPMMRDGVITI